MPSRKRAPAPAARTRWSRLSSIQYPTGLVSRSTEWSGAAGFRQQLRLMLGHQRVDDLAQRLAFDDLRQLVECEIDAVVADAALRKIISSDALGAIAGANLAAALGGAGGVLLLALMIVKPRAQHRHGLGAVAMLRAILLHHHDDAGWDVGDADRGLRLVDVLAAGPARPQGVDLEVALVDRDVDVLG